MAEQLLPKTVIRYVVFSKKRGIYLGEGYWSADRPQKIKGAQTFTEMEADDMIRSLPSDGDYEKRQVNPTCADGITATEEDCVNAFLPRWLD